MIQGHVSSFYKDIFFGILFSVFYFKQLVVRIPLLANDIVKVKNIFAKNERDRRATHNYRQGGSF